MPRKRKFDKITEDPHDDPPFTNKYIEQFEIHNITDLIKIGEDFKDKYRCPKYISKRRKKNKGKDELERLVLILPYLKKLNDMIGLEDIKKTIVNQIQFFLQGLHQDEMLHSIITGPPGTGKTTLAKILAQIYAKLGFLSRGHVIMADRSDLIGQYLGETAIKTKTILQFAVGGVLFIDECYSLGNPEGRDSFSKECIDTLNQFLSENTDNFVCIIAGYKESIEECFLKANKGLDRRFPWRYNITDYKAEDLCNIFKFQVEQNRWKLEDSPEIKKYFEKDKEHFKFGGGDTLTLLTHCKIEHSKRIFGKTRIKMRTLTKKDIQNGFEQYIKNSISKKKKDTKIPFMYI